MPNRDNFSAKIKKILAERVGNKCSKPNCRAETSGPRLDATKAANMGDAAHITAAAMEGPRYDSSLTPSERADYNNGIWLCAIHARQVDSDAERFPVSLLRKWKNAAEARALKDLGRPKASDEGKLGIATQAERLGPDTAALLQDGKVVLYTTICKADDPDNLMTHFINGFVVQSSIRKREERTYLVIDCVQATVHETAPIPPHRPLAMAYPAKTGLYYIEISPNEPFRPAIYRASRAYAPVDGGEQVQFPRSLVVDDPIPAQIAIRINATTPAMYLVSIEAVVSSGNERETLTLMQPQHIIFEKCYTPEDE